MSFPLHTFQIDHLLPWCLLNYLLLNHSLKTSICFHRLMVLGSPSSEHPPFARILDRIHTSLCLLFLPRGKLGNDSNHFADLEKEICNIWLIGRHLVEAEESLLVARIYQQTIRTNYGTC
ncbi:hypothetical protein EUGRSUZ_E03083 [Eucalyptus grandis]|uniref:Uncharacterized protein n=2 Tax=Eucalyptus grandis TaxID=71139 RepID=A0ACC3KYR4_EUCGR|nr:hypothetical protein EUGRSUZ_E03083 [Eucalyptus grandis]